MNDINTPSQGDPAVESAGVGQQRVGETSPAPKQKAEASGFGPTGPGSGDSATDAGMESERVSSRQPADAGGDGGAR